MTLILMAAVVFAAGCTTKYVARSAEIEAKSRVGVILVSNDGDRLVPAVQYPYVYNKLMAHGLVPVSLAETGVEKLFLTRPSQIVDVKAQNITTGMQSLTPALTPVLQAYLIEKKVDYLMVASFWASGLDEHLRAVVIRTSDMNIIASKFYDYSFMKGYCIPTAFIGIGLLTCPFFYLANYDEMSYGMLEDLMKDITGGK
ncbi:MAG: hypothetical protein WC405_21385 [Syntrophales bacterium]